MPVKESFCPFMYDLQIAKLILVEFSDTPDSKGLRHLLVKEVFKPHDYFTGCQSCNADVACQWA